MSQKLAVIPAKNSVTKANLVHNFVPSHVQRLANMVLARIVVPISAILASSWRNLDVVISVRQIHCAVYLTHVHLVVCLVLKVGLFVSFSESTC